MYFWPYFNIYFNIVHISNINYNTKKINGA
jgi:hypothetical protein